MSNRAALLETTLKARLVDTRKHLEALERAAAGFPNETSGSRSPCAGGSAGARAVHGYPLGGYEKVIDG